jgi:radical SAM protein with 4Fe4S-binding SPASM domain
MYDSLTYVKEIMNQLKTEAAIRIIDDFADTTEAWGIAGRINFTGGDPLLRDDIFELISHARQRKLIAGILGNPYHLNMDVAAKLKELGIHSYQVSIDGMRHTHDKLRGMQGSFDQTIAALRILIATGIRTVVMFTLSKANMKDLIEVIRLVARENVSAFDFGRMVPIGSGAKLVGADIGPEEYRNLLLEILEEYRVLRERGAKTRFGRKENLWYLLYQQLGLLRPPIDDDGYTVYSGCAVGVNLLTILADGTVLPCRRLPVIIGKVPANSIKEIFTESKDLTALRQIETMKKCADCNLLRFCRGMPCVAFGVKGNYFAPDPQCWNQLPVRAISPRLPMR